MDSLNKTAPRKVEIIAYHGWGMAADFWDPWDDILPDHVMFKKNDRGYFNEPVHHQFSEQDSIHILFVQGFGIHWVSKENWEKAHAVVLFSTFKYLEDIMSGGRRVAQVVNQLKALIGKKVYSTIEAFWKELFKDNPEHKSVDDYNIHDKDILINDLNAYFRNMIEHAPVQEKALIILLETRYDEISNFSQKHEMEGLFGKVDLHRSFEFVGHGFPFTHARECYDVIRDKIKVI